MTDDDERRGPTGPVDVEESLVARLWRVIDTALRSNVLTFRKRRDKSVSENTEPYVKPARDRRQDP